MQRVVLTWIVALSVLFSTASLVTNADAFNGVDGCCVCIDCFANSTVPAATSGLIDPATTSCSEASEDIVCSGMCKSLECGDYQFFNSSCSDPSTPAPALCSDDGLMAPAASPIGLSVLAAALCGFGAFFLRRRYS